MAHESSGRVTAKLLFEILQSAAPELIEKFKSAGIIRARQSTKDPQVPDSDRAVARLEIDLSNKPMLSSEEGLWPQIRSGLGNSLKAIFWSLSWVVFGFLFLLPWAALIYAGYRLTLRARKPAGPATPTA